MTQTGLPRATRTFNITFTLNGSPANPSTKAGEFYRLNKGGRKVVVDTLENADFTSLGETGRYSVKVQPDTHGEFYLRIWTAGDTNTQDIEEKVVVPAPASG